MNLNCSQFYLGEREAIRRIVFVNLIVFETFESKIIITGSMESSLGSFIYILVLQSFSGDVLNNIENPIEAKES